MTKAKIRICDDSYLRTKLNFVYELKTQIQVAKYSILLAKHILKKVGILYQDISEIREGFEINEMWQKGETRMYEVRQAGFKIHRLARQETNEIKKVALRVVGQAIGSGHMKEHGMVASDYAIKVINLLYRDNREEVRKERLWQIDALKSQC